jgi:hypothetical protein
LATVHAFEPLTCFACTKILQNEHDNQIQATRANREDEEEFLFQGIPIAGENDGDSEASWERASWDQEDEDETDNITQNHIWLSPVQGVNLRATDDIAFRIGPKKGIKNGHKRTLQMDIKKWTFEIYIINGDYKLTLIMDYKKCSLIA